MAPPSETRDHRIREYHVVNAVPAVDLEEGSWPTVEDGALAGRGTARTPRRTPPRPLGWGHASKVSGVRYGAGAFADPRLARQPR
jgi:hypothetical protein